MPGINKDKADQSYMKRIAGADIPEEKRTEIALTYIYGIGNVLARKIINDCKLDPDKRIKNLTEDEINRLQRELENYKIEGDLRREVQNNIKRLTEIESYRGIRHKRNLPVRGQRTRVNASKKRGKRLTIGTVRKDVVVKLGTSAK